MARPQAADGAEDAAWIEAYLAGLPADQAAALRALRATIAAAAPAAVEGRSYGLPAFRYRGRPLVAYQATKRHCSFFPMGPEVLDRYRDDLAGYDLAKGTVRFTPARPIPDALVRRVVRDRMAMIDAASGPTRR